MTRTQFGHRPDPDPATLRCMRCYRPCSPFGEDDWRHSPQRCGAAMRFGETCARFVGHANSGHGAGHRTRYALDNQALANNGRAARVVHAVHTIHTPLSLFHSRPEQSRSAA